jgi:hypothetical protein
LVLRERERRKKSLKEKKKKKKPKAIPSLLRAYLCTPELRRESYQFHATTPTLSSQTKDFFGIGFRPLQFHLWQI